jgi:hypothetical protein
VINNLSHFPQRRGELTLRAVDELEEVLAAEASLDENHVRDIQAQIRDMLAGSNNRASKTGTARQALACGSLMYSLLGAVHYHPNLTKEELAPFATAARRHFVKDSQHTFLKGQKTGFATWSKMKKLLSVVDGSVSLNADGIALWASTPKGDYRWSGL